VLDRDLNASKSMLAVGQHCLASAEKLSDSSGGVVTQAGFTLSIYGLPTPVR